MGKHKLVRYKGGIQAGSVYYRGSAIRQPFAYFVRGNLQFNIAGLYHIPLSFIYSNQQFDFPNPFNFNRVSLHPSYKWINTHIGDIQMSFSPYTLDGHQFTGVGVDLTPGNKIALSVMYGRLIKATEPLADTNEMAPYYKRMGAGVKLIYTLPKMKLGIIYFQASDRRQSVKTKNGTSFLTAPKANTVFSLQGEGSLIDNLRFHVEYAWSLMKISDSLLVGEGITTDTELLTLKNHFHAVRAGIDYPAGRGSLGINYERIDPNYQTLGAYYFNNDLESISFRGSQAVFNNKLNISLSAGLQRDNLNEAKSSDFLRFANSVNVSFIPKENWNISASYSDFKTVTNFRDPVKHLNEVRNLKGADTLNYRQIAQNANINAVYRLRNGESTKGSVTLNLGFQSSENRQENKAVENGSFLMYNAAAGYSSVLTAGMLNYTLSLNASYSVSEIHKGLFYGPSLSLGREFFAKELKSRLTTSFNTANSGSNKRQTNFNFNLSNTYTLRQNHSIGLSALMQIRKGTSRKSNDVTISVNYAYRFNNFKINLHKRTAPDRSLISSSKALKVRISYRDINYAGLMSKVTFQLGKLLDSTAFVTLPYYKSDECRLLYQIVRDERKPKLYKEKAMHYLKSLYDFKDFTALFQRRIHDAIERIRIGMVKSDHELERRYMESRSNLNLSLAKTGKYNSSEINQLKKMVNQHKRKLLSHRWMEKVVMKYSNGENFRGSKELMDFSRKYGYKYYQLYKQHGGNEYFGNAIESEIIDHFYNLYSNTNSHDEVELRYQKITGR